MMRLCGSVVLALASSVSCAAEEDPEPGTTSVADDDSSTGTTSTSEGSSTSAGPFTIEQCDDLLTQADCDAAVITQGGPDRCLWIEARIPTATCTGDVTVPQCVGMFYVGDGCIGYTCPGGRTSVLAYFREVDGSIQVFADESCGSEPVGDWSPCAGQDVLPECDCLCPT